MILSTPLLIANWVNNKFFVAILCYARMVFWLCLGLYGQALIVNKLCIYCSFRHKILIKHRKLCLNLLTIGLNCDIMYTVDLQYIHTKHICAYIM